MSDNDAMTIVEFLEARIAEDERMANDLLGEREGGRVLAECAAKRGFIRYSPPKTLGYLASVYKDHQDYQQEWANGM